MEILNINGDRFDKKIYHHYHHFGSSESMDGGFSVFFFVESLWGIHNGG